MTIKLKKCILNKIYFDDKATFGIVINIINNCTELPARTPVHNIVVLIHNSIAFPVRNVISDQLE